MTGVGANYILNYMVKYEAQALDRTFSALADPTRRALLAHLCERRSASISELAMRHPLSLPAVMKHLDVLAGAGLILREKSGRTVTCRTSPGPMTEAMQWLEHYARFWNERLDRLAMIVEEEPE